MSHVLRVMYSAQSPILVHLFEYGGKTLACTTIEGPQEAARFVSRLLEEGDYLPDMKTQVGTAAAAVINMRLSCMCCTSTEFKLPLYSGMAQVMPRPKIDMTDALGLTEIHSLQARAHIGA